MAWRSWTTHAASWADMYDYTTPFLLSLPLMPPSPIQTETCLTSSRNKQIDVKEDDGIVGDQ